MKYHKKTLKNGLRVIVVPMEDSTTVTVLVMVEAGSAYETKDTNGISHFLEHMCFKGTKLRPRTFDITRDLDSIGAEYNAFTDVEHTGYYAKSHPKHFSKILDVVADLYLNPAFDEAEIEKEKKVIVEEINMYEDSPSDLIDDVFETHMYGDQPAGWPVIGTKATVQAVTRDALVDYRKRHYVASATTVVVAGKVDHKHAFAEIAKKFDGMSTDPKEGRKKFKESQSKPEIHLRYKDSEQSHVALGVRAYPVGDERNYALRVLNAVLGGGMSSRLWQRVRNELGAAYYVYPYPSMYSDHGYFAVYAGIDNGRVSEVVGAVMEELRALRKTAVPEDELKKAKDYLLGRIYLKLETSDELAGYYASQEVLHEDILKPAELAKKLRAVTSEDVRRVANDLLRNRKLNLALIGRYKGREALEKLLVF